MTAAIYQAITDQHPVILNLTNAVTVEFVANCQLAIGASPVMSADYADCLELLKICAALYVNIGTMSQRDLNWMIDVAKNAHAQHIPIVLDPVGAGATTVRTTWAEQFLSYTSLVKGNGSEIMALSGCPVVTQGVDSTESSKNAISSAKQLASSRRLILITGKMDVLTDGENEWRSDFGVPLMQQVTGMGCALGGVLAAGLGTGCTGAALMDIVTGYNMAAEQTYLQQKRPGRFKSHFIDELAHHAEG